MGSKAKIELRRKTETSPVSSGTLFAGKSCEGPCETVRGTDKKILTAKNAENTKRYADTFFFAFFVV
jgi:hypothetical protein